MEKIICSAIHYRDGKKYVHQPKNIEGGFVVCGLRHDNCFMTVMILADSGRSDELKGMEKIQGFLTDQNRFVDREEARTIALEAGQLAGRTVQSRTKLYSEDLY